MSCRGGDGTVNSRAHSRCRHGSARQERSCELQGLCAAAAAVSANGAELSGRRFCPSVLPALRLR